ncbi:hypothetical protein GSI_03233 [Ganoderma sinense ZZ0214-1]|uniref:Uncharacterized protein n=1 Tax=Ganoderma sinense ZZ0214-1 TaxID=1077348 RepID=A0A2G8SL22_9APHY|nr:hypothetical protein GSI_03233 [Ganoderma sinense ZZ0214-1]
MDTTSRVVGRQLEVADRHAGQVVERLERDVLLERDTIEGGTEGREAQLVTRDRPGELFVVEQERREVSELGVVRDRQTPVGLPVRNTLVRSGADRRKRNLRDVAALPSDRDGLNKRDLSIERTGAGERTLERQVETSVRDVRDVCDAEDELSRVDELLDDGGCDDADEVERGLVRDRLNVALLEGEIGGIVIDLDGAVNVERDLEVLERIQDRIVDVKLLPADARRIAGVNSRDNVGLRARVLKDHLECRRERTEVDLVVLGTGEEEVDDHDRIQVELERQRR